MNSTDALISEIEAYCRQKGIAESTFGRRVVNDGKFVSRLRAGKRTTTVTLDKIQTFIRTHSTLTDNGQSAAGETSTLHHSQPPSQNLTADDLSRRSFRFYDNRQKYLLFVSTCSEKWVIAERVGMELVHLHPQPPALRIFDAGMGDGTVLTRVMRHMHDRFPTIPFYIVGKEISLEDVRLSLEKMPDRFHEHPATVLIVTNLYYTEAPRLMPRSLSAAAALNWHEVSLSGTTAHEFEEQITALQPVLADGWRVQASAKTGNPLYVRPSVLILYREDHKFLLDQIIPKPGHAQGQYDLLIASQPYRARMPVDFKVKKVLAPLAQSLLPGGRMLVVQSFGQDPGLEIIQNVWSGEDPFQTNRHQLLKALKAELERTERDLRFNAYADTRAIFRYDMHTLPSEIGSNIGTSTLFAAWNAATYVAQIADDRLEEVMSHGSYLEATRDVLQKHGGLWFLDESFVVSRRRA